MKKTSLTVFTSCIGGQTTTDSDSGRVGLMAITSHKGYKQGTNMR